MRLPPPEPRRLRASSGCKQRRIFAALSTSCMSTFLAAAAFASLAVVHVDDARWCAGLPFVSRLHRLGGCRCTAERGALGARVRLLQPVCQPLPKAQPRQLHQCVQDKPVRSFSQAGRQALEPSFQLPVAARPHLQAPVPAAGAEEVWGQA